MTGAKVKPLDWHNFDAWTYWAEAVCGTYHVEERNGWWQVELRVGGLAHIVAVTDDTLPANLEAAKAAAQADYEARILAALTPTPVDASQAADPVVNAPDPAAIREALLIVQSHADYVRDEGAYDAGWNAAVQSIAAAIKPLIEKGAAE